jgi:hypothetical protein
MSAGASRNAQDAEAQSIFNQTLSCSPLSNAGDHWEITCTKPSVFPITIIHNNERVRSWVDNTSIRSIQEEARRLLGASLKVDRVIEEPGLVYKTVGKQTRSKKQKPVVTTKNRSFGSVKLASPSVAHMRAAGPQDLDLRSHIGRDAVAKGPDFAPIGCEIVVMMPQM